MGENERRLVHSMLKEEIDVTIQELRQRMTAACPYFTLSSIRWQRYIFERSDLALKRSLYLRKVEEALVRGDCVVYMDETWVFGGMVKRKGWVDNSLTRQRYIFERSDLALKRSLYLRKVEEALVRGDCVVYMDETWVFGGMVKRKGWVDNSLTRFTAAEEIRQYSWGKTAGKNKGKRGIVITALCDGGVIPGLHPCFR
ncbi:hypothetical protein COOONC_04225 [Cooperia oncophora]